MDGRHESVASATADHLRDVRGVGIGAGPDTGRPEEHQDVPAVQGQRGALTPELRSQRARIAANTRWGKTADRTAATAPATRAWNARFEELADPDGRMTPEQRARAAESLKRAHFQRMAYRSAQVRRARKQKAG